MKYIFSFVVIAILALNPAQAIFHKPCSSLRYDATHSDPHTLVMVSSSCDSPVLKQLYLNRAEHLMQLEQLTLLSELEFQILGQYGVANNQLIAYQIFMDLVEAMSQSMTINNEVTAGYLNQVYLENKVGVEKFVEVYYKDKK